MTGGPGPVALVGSGEFLPVMVPVDRELLAGRAARAVVIPTAAAREGDRRVAYWLELGRAHFEAMGVDAVLLDVRTRRDADAEAVARAVEGAGLVYLSGGDPHHLSDTLRDTALWDAVRTAWAGGTAVGGCSAGAMALTSGAPVGLVSAPPDRRSADDAARAANGLGLVGGLAVIPHFDQMDRVRPGALERFASWQPPGTTLVGIEERTAVVGTGDRWRVRGEGAVWVLGPEGRSGFRAGDEVPLAPERAATTDPGRPPR
jgi:cyanophycinase